MANFAMAHAMKRKKMAKGGIAGDANHNDEARRLAQYNTDDDAAHLTVPMTKQESTDRMGNYLGSEDDHNTYAKGGEVDRGDIVERAMKKYAQGGVVADEGEGELSKMADSDENDFDYLAEGDLDDSTTNSGAADGDEHGNAQEAEDRKDIVARVMRQRSMKQRNPRPA